MVAPAFSAATATASSAECFTFLAARSQMMLLMQFVLLVTYTINEGPSFFLVTLLALKDYIKSQGPVLCLLLLI